MTTAFTFDKDYDNKEQVRGFLPAFSALREGLEARGDYPYNDSFKGLIPGIVGDDEDTGIYLLQTLFRIEEERQTIADMCDEGMVPLDALDERKRFSRVVLYRDGHYCCGTGQIYSFDDARIEPKDGKPFAVLPKGKRTRGHLVAQAQVFVTV